MQLATSEFATQFTLAIIMLLGAALLLSGRLSAEQPFLFFGVPIGLLLIVSALHVWGHFIPWPLSSLASPIQCLLCLDLGLACLLVLCSGGSFMSPFAPILFTLPAFALQLGQKWEFLRWFVLAIIICFLVTLRYFSLYKLIYNNDEFGNWKPDTAVRKACLHDTEQKWIGRSYAAVSVSCFILSAVIPLIPP